jgi:hypothetical protein
MKVLINQELTEYLVFGMSPANDFKTMRSDTTEIVVIGHERFEVVQRQIVSCEHCDSLAAIPFDQAFNILAGKQDKAYMLCEPAHCPNCNERIIEGTLVSFDNELEAAVIQHVARVFEPADDTDIVFVDAGTLLEAESRIVHCERCCGDAELTFDYVLDALTQCDPAVTEYLLCRPAKCPTCLGDVTEKTLVVLD